MNLLDYLKIFPNTFPEQVSEILMNLSSNSYPAVVSSVDKDTTVNSDYRKTDNVIIPKEIEDQLKNSISDFWNSYLIRYYPIKLKQVETPQFLCYNINGKYDVHNDSEDFVDGRLKRLVNRDVTILAYLNDDYDGGELEFPDFGIKIKPKRNMVITFPSYYEFQHKVNPVTLGKRYTIATWIETEERIYDRPYELGRS